MTDENAEQETPELTLRQKNFIEAYLKAAGVITRACREADIHKNTYYLWIKDWWFKDALEEAKKEFEERLVGRLLQDALDKKKMNTTAAIFLLKSMNPEKYDDNLRRTLKEQEFVERTSLTDFNITINGRPINKPDSE